MIVLTDHRVNGSNVGIFVKARDYSKVLLQLPDATALHGNR